MTEHNLSSTEIDAQRDQRHDAGTGIKILFLYTVNGRGNAGDVVVVSAGAARDLIARGLAEAV